MDNIRTNFCVGCKEAADRVKQLEAENARLREALRAIIYLDHHNMGASSTWANVARAALAGKADQ